MTGEIPPAALLERLVSPEQKRYLNVCAEAASDCEMPLYLVGGAIRDLLLTGRCLELDLDLVTEGNALELAELVAERLQGELTTHSRFMTSEVRVGGTHIDLVSARTERYEEPASLPVVSPSTLEADLARRDFTVNAMALPLWPSANGGLIDPWNGAADLERRQLRVLYERSFFDDPTRILRGVRIGARLDLSFEPQTADLARAAITAGAFDPLSPSRLRNELVLLLEDRQVEVSLRHLEALGFWSVLGASSPLRDSAWAILGNVLQAEAGAAASPSDERAPRWWLVKLTSLFANEDATVRTHLAERLGLDRNLYQLLVNGPRAVRETAAKLAVDDLAPHDVCRILAALEPEEVAFLRAQGPTTSGEWIDRWTNDLRQIDLSMGGDELRDLGFDQSPSLGAALQKTLEARQDGMIGATEELEFAIRLMKEDEGRDSE